MMLEMVSRKYVVVFFFNPLHLSLVSDRDLREFGGHPSGPLEAAVAGERDSALPHPPPGRQPEPPRTHR